MDIYFYKMTTDNGGAPCVADNLWTLAICKPKMRATAQKGALIFGFAGKRLDSENGLVHVAKVAERLEDGTYYDKKIFHDRPDCIYRREGNGWSKIDNRFHRDKRDIDRDLGKNREHTHVLMSDEFRYFGRERFGVDRDAYPLVREALDRLTQGHRRFHDAALYQELLQLSREAFTWSDRKVCGAPTQQESCKCNSDDDEPDAVCSPC